MPALCQKRPLLASICINQWGQINRTGKTEIDILLGMEKIEYVSGLLESELWKITRDEWNSRQVG